MVVFDAINAVGLLVALAQSARQSALDAIQCRDTASPLGKPLTWVVSRVDDWKELCTESDDIYERLKECLVSINVCLQAAGCKSDSANRAFVKRQIGGRPLVDAMKEAEDQLTAIIQEFHIEMSQDRPVVKCRAFEDNSGALAIATVPRARPRTKHLAIRLHHFKEHVGRDVDIEKVSTDEQHGDMETKSLPSEKLSYHRFFVQGW